MPQAFTYDAFAKNLQTHFQIEHVGADRIDVELVEVSLLPTPASHEAFSIVFRGPAGSFIAQGTYGFRHDAFGAFELFIVPIRQDQHGLYYEAVFNRLRDEEQR